MASTVKVRISAAREPLDLTAFDALIDSAASWGISYRGKTRQLFCSPVDTNGRILRIGTRSRFIESDFEELVPGFGATLRDMWTPCIPGARMPGADMQAMRDYGLKKYQTWPLQAFATAHAGLSRWPVIRVMDITLPENRTQLVLTVKTYALRTTRNGALYAQTEVSMAFTVKRAWFDRQHPGWLQRYQTAQVLGLTDEDAAHHALTVSSCTAAKSTDLPSDSLLPD